MKLTEEILLDNGFCTTREQSKKLVSLGLSRTTSDMYYYNGEHLMIGGCKSQDEELDVPAWSLSALLNSLPSCITFMQKIDGKYHGCIELSNDDLKEEAKGEFGSIIHSCVGSDIIDVVFDLMVWYLTNKIKI